MFCCYRHEDVHLARMTINSPAYYTVSCQNNKIHFSLFLMILQHSEEPSNEYIYIYIYRHSEARSHWCITTRALVILKAETIDDLR